MLAGLTEWLDAYGHAWESRDGTAAGALFAEDGVYQWGPFGRRLRGSVMIREAWTEAVETQANIEFGYEVMAATANGGIARWWCRFDRAGGKKVRLEGIFRLAFDDDSGLCTSLEEWWNSAEDPA